MATGSPTIFCRPGFIDLRRLYERLRQVIALSPTEFDRVYQALRNTFDRPSDSPFLHDFVRKPIALVNPELLQSPNPEHPGIDLPCWLETSGSDRRIILLGQDPLRDDRYFPHASQSEPSVVIGTPYSVHSASLRRQGNNPRYWGIISKLLAAGYNLYLTDVGKFWARGQRARAASARTYRMILEEEFALSAPSGSPSLIVTFGKQAAAFLLGADYPATTKIGKETAQIFSRGPIRVLPVLHPSPQNEGILKAYLRANEVDPDQGVSGIAEVITKTISRFGGRRP